MTGSEFETRSSWKIASIRLIESAIDHFEKKELECTIVLAHAAENILPSTHEPHLFKQLNEYLARYPGEGRLDFNLAVNWLKHHKNPEEVTLTEFEGAVVILRAITKFIAVYHQLSRRMDKFIEWARERGFYPRPTAKH